MMVNSQKQNIAEAIAMSDAIIINDHVAVVLKYEEDVDLAPVIVAKGTDEMVLQIKTIGYENGVHIVHNLSLADALYSNSEVGKYIPEELYASVAEMMAKIASSKKHKTLS